MAAKFETDVTAQVEELQAAQSAPKTLAPHIDRLIDRWVSTELAGTELADSPERWNMLKGSVGNLKNLLAIEL